MIKVWEEVPDELVSELLHCVIVPTKECVQGILLNSQHVMQKGTTQSFLIWIFDKFVNNSDTSYKNFHLSGNGF